jgi:two-component system response regulator AlgR
MKTLIVDDEPLARARLAGLLEAVGGLQVVGEAADGRRAVELAGRLRPDLVLLDINMPLMDGLEAARHLAALDPPPAVIFCTAYDEHALAAFDANAVDYLVKPIRLERLRSAIARAQRFGAGATGKSAAAEAAPVRRTHLCARVRGNLVLVPVADIDYLLAEDKYTVVHHAGGQVLIEEPLKALEAEFDARFVRIHRNCLVAKAKLAALVRAGDERVVAQIAGSGALLEVSRRNLPALRKLAKGA